MTMLVVCQNCNGEGRIDTGVTDFDLVPIYVDCGFCFGTGCVEEDIHEDAEDNT